MKLLLCVPASRPGEGGPIGAELLRWILSLGFSGVRVDCPEREDRRHALLEELAAAGGPHILLLAPGKMRRLSGAAWTASELEALARSVASAWRGTPKPLFLEVGNEPDLTSWPPEMLAATTNRCLRAACSSQVHIILGGISNLNRHGLDYLRWATRYGLLPNVAVGFHRYGTPEKDILKPHDGFPTRDAEMARLKQLAGGRTLLCTETGDHTAPKRYGCLRLRKAQLSEAKVIERQRKNLQHMRSHGVETAAIYQLNSGPDPNNPEDNYGIRSADGIPLERARGFSQLIRELAEEKKLMDGLRAETRMKN